MRPDQFFCLSFILVCAGLVLATVALALALGSN